MGDKKYYLTKEGLEKIKKDHESLREERKRKLKEETPDVFHSEDINPEYLSFQKELNLLESKISKLEEVLHSAEIIKPPRKDSKEVQLGATVTVQVGKRVDEFVLVGTMEADPSYGKISNESPVGCALLGRKEGEEVTVSSKVGVVYKIKKVSYK